MIEYLSGNFSIGGALGGLVIFIFHKRGLDAKLKGLQLQIDQLKRQQDTKDDYSNANTQQLASTAMNLSRLDKKLLN